VRRKIVRKAKPSAAQDDKKLQGALKKLNVQPIPGVEEVNMFQEDGNVLHFTAPKGMFPISRRKSTLTNTASISSRRVLCQHFRHLRHRARKGTHGTRTRHPEPARPRFPRLTAQTCRVVPGNPTGPAATVECRRRSR
jgi:NAC domain